MTTAQLTFDDLLAARKDGRNAAAWSVVMDCHDDITRYCRQMASNTLTVSFDELFNESVTTIVERFEHFDIDKGKATKWCYWQVRRACTSLLREAGAGRRILCAMNPSDPDPMNFIWHEGVGDARHLEALAQASIIMDKASPEEAAAIRSKAEGWSGPEVQEKLGLSMAARNQRIYRFRRRIESVQETA